MEKIIINYLDKNYMFCLLTLSSYTLYDKMNKTDISLKSIWRDMEKIFAISKENFERIWGKWIE